MIIKSKLLNFGLILLLLTCLGIKVQASESELDNHFSQQEERSYKLEFKLGTEAKADHQARIFANETIDLKHQKLDKFIEQLVEEEKIASRLATILSNYRPGYIIKADDSDIGHFGKETIVGVSKSQTGSVELEEKELLFMDYSHFTAGSDELNSQLSQIKIFHPNLNEYLILINSGKQLLVFQKIGRGRIYLGSLEAKELLGFSAKQIEFVDRNSLIYKADGSEEKIEYSLEFNSLSEEKTEIETWGDASAESSDLEFFNEEKYLYNQAKESGLAKESLMEYLYSFPTGQAADFFKTKLKEEYGVDIDGEDY